MCFICRRIRFCALILFVSTFLRNTEYFDAIEALFPLACLCILYRIDLIWNSVHLFCIRLT